MILRKTLLAILLSFLLSNKVFASFASSSVWASLAIPAVAGAYSIYIEDYQGARQLVYAELLSGQITALLKQAVTRTRPDGSNDSSFPSAEASIGFAGASYVQHRYGLLSSVPFYVATSAICVERVNVKQQYWSDVVVGAALGYVTAAFFTTPNFTFSPDFEPRTKYCGFRFSWRI